MKYYCMLFGSPANLIIHYRPRQSWSRSLFASLWFTFRILCLRTCFKDFQRKNCSRLLPSVSSIAFNNQFSHRVFPKERCAYKYGCVSCYRAQICDGLHVRRRDEVARSLRSRCELLRRLRQTEVSTAKDSAELACVNGITCMTRRPTQVIGCNCTQFRSYYI